MCIEVHLLSLPGTTELNNTVNPLEHHYETSQPLGTTQ